LKAFSGFGTILVIFHFVFGNRPKSDAETVGLSPIIGQYKICCVADIRLLLSQESCPRPAPGNTRMRTRNKGAATIKKEFLFTVTSSIYKNNVSTI